MDKKKKGEQLTEEISFRENDLLYEQLKNLSSKKIAELHNSIFKQDKPQSFGVNNVFSQSKPIYSNKSSPKNFQARSDIDEGPSLQHQVQPSTMTHQLRISALEKRLEKSEKMLKYFEEMFKNKESERDNEFKLDRNKINDLNKRIMILEENIKSFQKKINSINEVFIEKFSLIEKKFHSLLNSKEQIVDFYTNKLQEIENVLRKNESLIDNTVDKNLNNLKLSIDNKFEDILNIINEVSHNSDTNELKILESRDTIRNIQNDHMDFLKVVTILKEKADTLDYVMDQIGDLKNKYLKIIKIFNEESNEENKFLNKIFNTDQN